MKGLISREVLEAIKIIKQLENSITRPKTPRSIKKYQLKGHQK